MYYVYLIKSKKIDFIYVGSCSDLKRRFFQHNKGYNRATKLYAPFELIYYEAYKNKKDALSREIKLKHHGSVIGHLKKRLKYSFSEK